MIYAKLILRLGRAIALAALIAAAAMPADRTDAQTSRQLRIGFFQPGEYQMHEVLREAYRQALSNLLPDSIEALYLPIGFNSAGWKRDSSKVLARRLAATDDLDLIVTMGPWTVEDLLEAGYTKPIVSMFRVDPVSEGLVTRTGRPIAENLSVQIQPGKFDADFAALNRLFSAQRVGFLCFHDQAADTVVLAKARQAGNAFGFDMVTADGFDDAGTFAFFKALQSLPSDLDALYISPLWALTPAMMTEFMAAAARKGIPVFSSEGRLHIGRGATASNARFIVEVPAWFAAWRTVQIAQGAVPADLPTRLPEGRGLTVNREQLARFSIDLPEWILLDASIVGPYPVDGIEFYTLNQAISRAMVANPGHLAVSDALEAAEQAVRVAKSDYLPQVRAQGRIDYVSDNDVTNRFDEITNEQYQAGLQLNQPILSQATLKTIKLAAQRKDLSATEAEQASRDLEEAVTLAYLDLCQAEAIVTIEEDYRERLRYFEASAFTRQFLDLQAGELPATFWETERLQANQRMASARRNRHVALTVFNALLNSGGDTPALVDSAAFSADAFRVEYPRLRPYLETRKQRERTLAFVVDQALLTSSQIEAGRKMIDVQRQRLEVNAAGRYPEIGFRARVDYRNELNDAVIGFDEKHTTWLLGAYVSLPIFEGAVRNRRRDQLRAELSKLEYLRDEKQLEVMQQVRTTAEHLFEQVDRIPYLWRADQLNTNQLQLIARAYDRGERGLADARAVLERWHRMRLEALDARYNYFRRSARLVHDVGWSAYETNRSAGQELAERLESYFRTTSP